MTEVADPLVFRSLRGFSLLRESLYWHWLAISLPVHEGNEIATRTAFSNQNLAQYPEHDPDGAYLQDPSSLLSSTSYPTEE